MLRRVSVREMLLLTLVAALIAIEVRERLIPSPWDAFTGPEVNQWLMLDCANDFDPSASLVEGELVGGLAYYKLEHIGSAVIDCRSAVHSQIIEKIKQDIRLQFQDHGWRYVESKNAIRDWEVWEVSAHRDGAIWRFMIYFLSPPTLKDATQPDGGLAITWAETGSAKRWNLEYRKNWAVAYPWNP